MLLRQALEQTRARMPAPVLFNSLAAILESMDEPPALRQGVLDVRFGTVHNRASIMSFQTTNMATGAQAS